MNEVKFRINEIMGKQMKKRYETPNYPEQILFIKEMKKKKITFTEVAEQLGMPQTTLSKKVHGFYSFKLHEVYKICDILGIDNPREVFL